MAIRSRICDKIVGQHIAIEDPEVEEKDRRRHGTDRAHKPILTGQGRTLAAHRCRPGTETIQIRKKIATRPYTGQKGQDRIGQDRTRQDRTGQDRIRQDKTGQDRTR